MKFHKVFEQAGAICALEKVKESPALDLVVEKDHKVDHAHQIATKMACPKCGIEQKESPSCIHCGIIIRKYLEREQALREAESAAFSSIKCEHQQAKNNSFFAPEKKGLQKGVVGGLVMMAIAVIWFVVGYAAGYIFFYPPILFAIGLFGFLRGLFTGNISG